MAIIYGLGLLAYALVWYAVEVALLANLHMIGRAYSEEFLVLEDVCLWR